MDYDNTNSGVLFKNDKEGNENRPDYKGKINVNGVDMELAAWVKTSNAGKTYMSLKASEPRQKDEKYQPSQKEIEGCVQGLKNDLADEIPF